MKKVCSKRFIQIFSLAIFIVAASFLIWFRKAALQDNYFGFYNTWYAGALVDLMLLLAIGAIMGFALTFIKQKFLSSFILSVVSVAFVLICAEAALRRTHIMYTALELRGLQYYSFFGFKPKGSFIRTQNSAGHWMESSEYKYWFPGNKYGFGEYDLDSVFKQKGVKVVGLGDSFTEGAGAPYDSSWVKQLAVMLNNDSTYPVPFIGVNLGISGSDPINSVAEFDKEIADYFHTDMAILAINQSDFHDVKVRGGFERYQADGTVLFPKAPWWEPYYAASHILRLLVHKLFDLDFNFVSKQQYTNNIPRYANSIEEACSIFAKSCKKKGIKPLVVLIPLMAEMKDAAWTPEMALLKQKIVSSNKVMVIDVLDYYLKESKGKPAPEQLFWERDFHCQSAGYTIVASAIKPGVIYLW